MINGSCYKNAVISGANNIISHKLQIPDRWGWRILNNLDVNTISFVEIPSPSVRVLFFRANVKYPKYLVEADLFVHCKHVSGLIEHGAQMKHCYIVWFIAYMPWNSDCKFLSHIHPSLPERRFVYFDRNKRILVIELLHIPFALPGP